MRLSWVALAVVAVLTACGRNSPTEPSNAASCANPAPLLSPTTCATPNAEVDDYIVRLRDGVDLRTEAARLGQKYGFTPEFFGTLPSFFGARLTRKAFTAMQCEPAVEHFECSNTNIPPP
jgi:hypothetical protein